NSGFDFALKGHGFSRAVSAAKSMAALAAEGSRGPQRENSGFDFALKGHGFSRAVSAAKSIAALAAEGSRGPQPEVFRRLLGGHKKKCGLGQPPGPHRYRGRSDCRLSRGRKIIAQKIIAQLHPVRVPCIRRSPEACA